MKALEEKIVREGRILPGNILKVGSFLNQQLDVDFLMEMGAEVARLYQGEKITKILTIEASGIAIATAFAAHLHVPVVFAKKHHSANQSDDVYHATVTSFTHGNTYEAIVAKEYLHAGDRVLLVDDFLATGEALRGLIAITKAANADLVGCAIAIEKGFQRGGDSLRAQGIRVESLAIIDAMSVENGIAYRRS
ncbi:MAG: xanthine phosphoribosyltransferase [Ruminococcus sp.]|nr:xanthine phosphoribosyltransferase [Candidatus Apopatosoma intestinale]